MKFKTVITTIITLFILPPLTYAVFFDKHTSPNNTFSATTLDSEINTTLKQETKFELLPDKEITYSFSLTNIGELNTYNSIEIVKITDEKFASKIFSTVVLDEIDTIYKGPLNEMNIENYIKQNKKDTNKLAFSFTITEKDYDSTAGQQLEFVVVNNARQFEKISDTGFYDKESVHIILENTKVPPLIIPFPIVKTESVNIFEEILNNE
jgi:glycerophosphoryl diester phosphodiesterase